MTFRDIIDKFEEKKDKMEKKLEEIEEDMDQDEVPPWYGTKDGDSTNSKEESTGDHSHDSFRVSESDEEVVIEIDFPGYPRENLDANVDDGTLYITADKTERREARTYEYELSDTAVVSEITAEYEHGVLTVTVPQE